MRNGWTRVGVGVIVAVVAFEMFSNHYGGAPQNAFAAFEDGTNESSPGMIAFVSEADGQGNQRLYVVSPGQQVFAVYRVEKDGKKDKVTLISVRNFAADLQIAEFNTEPEITRIEEMLGQKPRRQ